MRLTVSAAVTTLGAAALLVVGVDYTTYAVTGSSLLLGRVNHSDSRTVVIRDGPGAALSLRSEAGSPSLRVSSDTRVPRLNADLLDGRHGWQLTTRVVSYRAGARGDVEPGLAFWRLDLEPGAYQASFKAFLVPDAVPQGTTVDVICGLADLNTLGPNTTVYAADSATYSNQFPTLMSGADTVRIAQGADPGMVCTTSNNQNFTLFKPFTSSWNRVDKRTVKTATPVTARSLHTDQIFAGIAK